MEHDQPLDQRTVMRSTTTTRQVTPWLRICLAGLFLSACGGSEEDPPIAKETEPTQDALDRLRALGYADGVAADEDEVTGVLFRDTLRSCPGYSLYGVQKLSRADLIDEEGKLIRSWHLDDSRSWGHCELLENGDLLVVGHGGTPHHSLVPDDSRFALRFDWNGELLWRRQLQVHHDIEETPDGNLIALAYERRLVPPIHATVEIVDDHILQLSPGGEVLESLSMLACIHKSGKRFPLARVAPIQHAETSWIDLLHSNSVERMSHDHLREKHAIYGPNNVLVSFRHQDRVAIFDLEKEEVVWQWGEGEIFGPHDAQVLETGNILLFDNGLGRQPPFSRALELNPITNEIVWEYRADPPTDLYTASQGSVQRLPNGNTLIGESNNGRAIEVTPDGDVVWEFICPHRVGEDKRAAIIRIKRFPKATIDAIAARNQTAPK